jgi:hypothetical protein
MTKLIILKVMFFSVAVFLFLRKRTNLMDPEIGDKQNTKHQSHDDGGRLQPQVVIILN